jgi:hypothetical protein
MSTVTEIEQVLPQLSAEDLMRVEAALRRVQRERGMGIIFDDAYGIWTEEDQASAVAEACRVVEEPPEPRA